MSEKVKPKYDRALCKLHTLLWHIRDEMGNKRAKARLTEAIELTEELSVEIALFLREASE